MTSYEQEDLARTRFCPKASWMAGLIAGILFLVLSRGFPWISSGLPDAIMGRPINFAVAGFLLASLCQLALSFLYSLAVGWVVYRFSPLRAVFVGGAVGLALYGLNFLVFRFWNIDETIDEGMVMAIHVIFCMLAASLYKAFSVRSEPGDPAGIADGR